MNDAVEMKSFASRVEFRNWLEAHHNQDAGIWIVFQKNDKAFSANDALEESLCFGWIDGLLKSIDAASYQKYFSRRKDAGNWSDKNKKIYQGLLAKGLVTKQGIEVYRPVSAEKRKIIDPADHIEALKTALTQSLKAASIFESKSASKQKQLAGFYGEAKTEETRQKRVAKIIEALISDDKGILY